MRLPRLVLALLVAFALLPATAAAAGPPAQQPDNGRSVAWTAYPRVKLPGFTRPGRPLSISVSGSGNSAVVLSETQLMKLNTSKPKARVLWRSAKVHGTDVVMNPKHQIAYVIQERQVLQVVNTFGRTPRLTQTISYECGPFCGVQDVAVTRNGKYLLVGYFDMPSSLDIYSLADPWHPKRVGRYRMQLRPESVATTPNGRFVIVAGVDTAASSHNKYMVLDIRRPKHVKLVKHKTKLPLADVGPIVPAPGGAHMYLLGTGAGYRVRAVDVKPSGSWPIKRNKAIMGSNNNEVTGADITTTGKYLYVTRGGGIKHPKMCIIGFAHLSQARCYFRIDNPVAGVALSKHGHTRDRAHVPEGLADIYEDHAWLQTISAPH